MKWKRYDFMVQGISSRFIGLGMRDLKLCILFDRSAIIENKFHKNNVNKIRL